MKDGPESITIESADLKDGSGNEITKWAYKHIWQEDKCKTYHCVPHCPFFHDQDSYRHYSFILEVLVEKKNMTSQRANNLLPPQWQYF